MDVLRAFGKEEDELTHYFSYSGGRFLNSIEYNSEFYDFEDDFEPRNDIEYKRYAKRFSKLAVYSVLSAVTGVSLPWGALTGIRPTKLAYMEREAGRDFVTLFRKMQVSADNIELVSRVLAEQEPYRSGGKSLYVSLPFCPTKCDYCSFITAPIDKTREYVGEYLDCVIKEITSSAGIAAGARSVYVGGGTPFVLGAKELGRIYAAINAVLPDCEEFTVEAGRPDTFSEEKLSVSKEHKVTRICVNPQSFNDSTLAAIGRKHTAEQTLWAYEQAEKFGFDINIDLIAGLAEETPEDFAYSLRKAIELSPADITVHTLSLKAGAKLKENVKRLNIAGIEEMISLSRELLTAAGYRPYYLYRQKYQAGGLENVGWCKKGKACLYNIDVMEEFADNIAVGANAVSKRIFAKDERIERCASPKDIPTYLSKIDGIISKRIEFFK